MQKFSFYKARYIRKRILDKYGDEDHVYFKGVNNVLISAPHGVSQTRLGKYKVPELGTIPLAILLQGETLSHVIIKTKNNFDDANFDEESAYKRKIEKLVGKQNIKYIIDIHGLAASRDIDVNLGVNMGENIKNSPKSFDRLVSLLSPHFKVAVDQPFMASHNTISSYFARTMGLFTIQIEVNCSLTNKPENIDRFNQLVEVLSLWISELK